MKKLIKTAVIIGVVVFGLFLFMTKKEGTAIEQAVELKEKATVIIQDTKSVYDGLKDFSKTAEVQKKVELVEKEAFLNYRKEIMQEKYEKEIAEIEAELDTVRGELSVS